MKKRVPVFFFFFLSPQVADANTQRKKKSEICKSHGAGALVFCEATVLQELPDTRSMCAEDREKSLLYLVIPLPPLLLRLTSLCNTLLGGIRRQGRRYRWGRSHTEMHSGEVGHDVNMCLWDDDVRPPQLALFVVASGFGMRPVHFQATLLFATRPSRRLVKAASYHVLNQRVPTFHFASLPF